MNDVMSFEKVLANELQSREKALKSYFLNDEEKINRFKRTLIDVARASGLAGCTVNSIVDVALKIEEFGLSIIPEKNQAYIMPFGDRATFVIGANGYKALAKREGMDVTFLPIWKGDEYRIEFSRVNLSRELVEYAPADSVEKTDANLICVVVAVTTDNWATSRHSVVGVDEILRLRNISRSWKAFKIGKSKSAIWDDWFDRMACLAAVKVVLKQRIVGDGLMAIRLQDTEPAFESEAEYGIEPAVRVAKKKPMASVPTGEVKTIDTEQPTEVQAEPVDVEKRVPDGEFVAIGGNEKTDDLTVF